jgi:N-hydroxyarylamine O-acetyltransferase
VSSPLDLAAYFQRIGHTGPVPPTLATLEALHQAHATTIPFENLDVLRGVPVRLDLESLQAKLVRGRRGGYCFEQNTLFAAVLTALGFRVTPLAARVRYGATKVLPRTHMALLVDVDGAQWLADVGFGAAGLLAPVPLTPGGEVTQGGWGYRVTEEPRSLVLQTCRPGQDWEPLYAFTLEPQEPVDFELANYYTSTHPDSVFRRMVIVQRLTPRERYTLRGREFLVSDGERVTVRTVGEEEVSGVLEVTFGVKNPHL